MFRRTITCLRSARTALEIVVEEVPAPILTPKPLPPLYAEDLGTEMGVLAETYDRLGFLLYFWEAVLNLQVDAGSMPSVGVKPRQSTRWSTLAEWSEGVRSFLA